MKRAKIILAISGDFLSLPVRTAVLRNLELFPIEGREHNDDFLPLSLCYQ
jgi:hypothetical protein